MHIHPECSPHANHKGLIWSELLHHFPYAIMSLALGFIVLSFLQVCAFHGIEPKSAAKGARKIPTIVSTFFFTLCLRLVVHWSCFLVFQIMW